MWAHPRLKPWASCFSDRTYVNMCIIDAEVHVSTGVNFRSSPSRYCTSTTCISTWVHRSLPSTILHPALTSLSQTNPQQGQTCTRVDKSFGTKVPQLLHFCVVLRGETRCSDSQSVPAYRRSFGSFASHDEQHFVLLLSEQYFCPPTQVRTSS